jgi:hypothetical protein
VPEPSTNQISEALEFSRFRFKLLEFLRLPFDIREQALREVLERTCGGVYRNYLARAERVETILKAGDTLDLNVHVPLSLDKFSGKNEYRLINGGIGHNLPQEAPQALPKP